MQRPISLPKRQAARRRARDLREREVTDLVPLGEVLLNGGDNLDHQERATLQRELQASAIEAEAGELDEFEVALTELPPPR